MLDSIKYFIQDYYGVIILWVAITLASAFFVHGCNQKEIRRLKAINQIDKAAHQKEIEVIQESNKKKIEELKKIQKEYSESLAEITSKYDKSLEDLQKQQKEIYETYLNNQDLMSNALVEYFGLKNGGKR